MPEAVDASREIADRCNVDLTLGNFFPNFKLPAGKTGDELYRELCLTE